MNARTFLLVALVAGGGVAASGCSSAEGPVAGELEVRLTSPNSDDRAVLLRLAGVQTAVTAPAGSGYRVLVAPYRGDTVRVVVMAPQGSHLAPGAVLRLTVPDTRQAASYAARVLDVASAGYLQRTTTGYSLSVVKP
jgi:hypothetical protein